MIEQLFESKELDVLHQKLNAPANIPPRGFMRNVVIYELVCYVNNIIGCYVSRNVEPIPIFIERSHIFVEKNSKDCTDYKEYIDLVLNYLELLEAHLKQYGVKLIR